MLVAILLIAAFQCYWLNKQYHDEYKSLKQEADVTFRETMYKLQQKRYEEDQALFEQTLITQQKSDSLQTKKRKAKQLKLSTSIVDEKKAYNELTRLPLGSLNKINPSQIDCVKVIKLNASIDGSIPPGLIEVFVKQRLKMDSLIGKSGDSTKRKYQYSYSTTNVITTKNHTLTDSIKKPSSIVMVYSAQKPIKKQKTILLPDSTTVTGPSPIIKLLTSSKSINDSIPIHVVDSAYKTELAKAGKKVNYQILFKAVSKNGQALNDSILKNSEALITSPVLIGFNKPFSYQAQLNNGTGFILHKMGWQIGVSILLLLFVIGSFITLYKNLLAQKRLADIKNEFISNITHELKTPISTVSVAIEALKNFGGLASPNKTKEYLDISSTELQRLSLLVDKVLKLSMFENKEMELSKEPINLLLLTKEVMDTLQLQFDKQQALVTLDVQGENFIIEADRIHLISVLYNLLDNALKYSSQQPNIQVILTNQPKYVQISVADKGIGIADAYKDKVFEKFFRVPSNNVHNTKGYGLGLSYVSKVLQKHGGRIQLISELGKGSTFTVQLPYTGKPTI